MKTRNLGYFYRRLSNRKQYFPLVGQIELTYRCNLNCIHCYCKGSEDKKRELTTKEWKKILDEIHKEGCIWLAFTGGNPLIRDDFWELYSYAKEKGFIITILTIAQGFSEEIINFLAKSPPFSIDITLNGITEHTYEAITQTEGSFFEAMKTIRILAKRKLPLILKTNCLKQNKHEVTKIKAFSEELLGRISEKKYRFRYDPMIYPRLNGDRAPCNYRLSYEELLELRIQDYDIWQEFRRGLHSDFPDLQRDRDCLYHCNSWTDAFFIDPYARLKFCGFSDKFSSDLKTTPFRKGFYEIFPKILDEKFKTNSKCRSCSLRPICYYCPARAFLETGNEESPVEYYCELAENTLKEKERLAR